MRAKTMKFTIAALLASAAFGHPPAEENLDRVFHFTRTETVEDLQQIATVVRSISETRHVSSDTAQRSLTLRGTPSQIAVADWLFNELDRSSAAQQSQSLAPHEFRPSASDDVVRVFYLTNTAAAQELQEISTVVRSMTDVRVLFTYTSLRALTLRGTAAQMALAEWLFSELD